MSDLESSLSSLLSSKDQDSKDRLAVVDSLVSSAVSKADVPSLRRLCSFGADERTPLIVSRPLFTSLAKHLPSLPAEIHKEVSGVLLNVIQSRAVAFEEYTSQVRLDLGRLLEQEGQWNAAAKALAAIPLDSGQRVLSPSFKSDIFIKIAELLLEDDDHLEAEKYINKASELIHLCEKDAMLNLRYQVSYARILDFKRQFQKACLKYHALSQNSLVNEQEQQLALNNAIKCGILAPAGPQRARALALLYRDERSARLPSYSMLSATLLDRIITPSEVAEFSKSLQPHHLAVNVDGRTFLETAVLEHNIISVSRLYCNISIADLGSLLSVTPLVAEQTTAKMIGEERLAGMIDQVQNVIYFQEQSSHPQAMFDRHVDQICYKVNDVISTLQTRFGSDAVTKMSTMS